MAEHKAWWGEEVRQAAAEEAPTNAGREDPTNRSITISDADLDAWFVQESRGESCSSSTMAWPCPSIGGVKGVSPKALFLKGFETFLKRGPTISYLV